jgi:3-hydroxyanthranilate 3,4-dioxygenase
MVTVVGGPNARTDYHINPTRSSSSSSKAPSRCGCSTRASRTTSRSSEGSIYLLPANVPHAPMRGPDTVGIIVERIRKGDHLDTHRWYCESLQRRAVRADAKIELLERDMPPIFEAYYGSADNQVCKTCGHVNPGRPQRG